MRRHGVPATLTSAGSVATTWLPGEAEALTGLARWSEVWHRFRQKHDRITTTRLTLAAWRHGVVLSGPALFSR